MASRIPHLAMVAQTRPKHTASIIFMHGSGGTGELTKQDVNVVVGRTLAFPHIRILYPTAPVRPYTLSDGLPSNVWFDRPCLSLSAPENLKTIEPMAEEINKLIDSEISQGIDMKRILIGGFSMGGCLGLQMGYRFRPEIGGVFALSSHLTDDSRVYEVLKSSPTTRRPPLFMCHGERDELVPYDWGAKTFQNLKERGVEGEFINFPRIDHSLCRKELDMWQDWILKLLPDIQGEDKS